MSPTEWNELALRLLALGQIGCHIQGRDGHYWVETGEPDRELARLHWLCKTHGVKLNDKFYGGVLEVLDTIDAVLAICGSRALFPMGEELTTCQLELGIPGADASCIDMAIPGSGWIA